MIGKHLEEAKKERDAEGEFQRDDSLSIRVYRIVFEEDMEECFLKWMEKAQSTQYSVY